MPNRINPNNPREVQHMVNGRWTRKQLCDSPAAAKRALKLQRGVAHGWEPTGQPARNTRRKAAGTPRRRR